jgi:hypothetical protein
MYDRPAVTAAVSPEVNAIHKLKTFCGIMRYRCVLSKSILQGLVQALFHPKQVAAAANDFCDSFSDGASVDESPIKVIFMIRFLLKAVLAVPFLFLELSPRLWVFGFGASLEAVLFIYWLLRKREDKPGKGVLICLSFLMLYLVYAFLLTTIARKAGSTYRIILVPFKAWQQIFKGNRSKLKEVFYNICLLTPLGALVPPLLKYRCRWKDILFLAFLYTMAVECTQLLFKLGYFEIDDILHNCLGAMIGYGGICLIRRFRRAGNGQTGNISASDPEVASPKR